MVERPRRLIGEVLDALERTGQEQDTLVLFASDNGGERFSYNWPLSGNKASVLRGRHPGADDPVAGPARGGVRSTTCRSTRPTGPRPSSSSAAPRPTRRTPPTAPAWCRTCFAGDARARARPVLAHPVGPGAAPRRPEVRADRRHRPPVRPRRRRPGAGRPRRRARGPAALRTAWEEVDRTCCPTPPERRPGRVGSAAPAGPHPGLPACVLGHTSRSASERAGRGAVPERARWRTVRHTRRHRARRQVGVDGQPLQPGRRGPVADRTQPVRHDDAARRGSAHRRAGRPSLTAPRGGCAPGSTLGPCTRPTELPAASRGPRSRPARCRAWTGRCGSPTSTPSSPPTWSGPSAPLPPAPAWSWPAARVSRIGCNGSPTRSRRAARSSTSR